MRKRSVKRTVVKTVQGRTRPCARGRSQRAVFKFKRERRAFVRETIAAVSQLLD